MTPQQKTVIDTLLAMMSDALPAMPVEQSLHVPFLEMGANSLVLMEVQRHVENRFGVNIAINQFFEELTHIEALAQYITEHSPSLNTPEPAPSVTQNPAPAAPTTVPLPNTNTTPPPVFNTSSSELEHIFQQQLHIATQTLQQVIAQQLDFLRGQGVTNVDHAVFNAPVIGQNVASAVAPTSSPAPVKSVTENTATVKSNTSPQHLLSPLEIRARGLTPTQQTHLEQLIQRFTEKTKTSKQLTQRYRAVLADSRATVGFRFTTKEMLYQIVGKTAKGSRIWDIDGNEYIDITMGQGVNLFGHQPDFILQALAEAQTHALPGPPRILETCEAAALICELTGLERVAFTNSGTEAVMAAIRLARAATKRNKIIMFENAYHGHSDFSLGKAQWDGDQLHTLPIASGIPVGAVQDTLLLPYGEESSLDYIRRHIHECAAIIVEPVQSRRPDLQPKAFLQTCRRLTEEAGALLIFDEMVTGFRAHPGGAQAWFGIRADLATYGKVLGGGLPVGVVAGRAKYMDGIDGGFWNYGDNSYPQAERTVFGGTFCQHPLAMATTLATLKHLKNQGVALQNAVNERTRYLAETLNAFFSAEEMPLKVVYFASLFSFSFTGNLEFLFYHLMLKGVFVWEWRNCFLSTAHTDEDVEKIIQAVKESLLELRAGGFIPEKTGKTTPIPSPIAVLKASDNQADQPLTEAQKQLWTLAKINPEGSLAYHIRIMLQLTGQLDVSALRQAINDVVARHEALRTAIYAEHQVIVSEVVLDVPLIDCRGSESTFTTWLQQELSTPFDLTKPPLFRATLVQLDAEHYRLALNAHHIVVDGYSINLIAQDIISAYNATMRGQLSPFSTVMPFKHYVHWQLEQLQTATWLAHENYWLTQWSHHTVPVLQLPTDFTRPVIKSYRGGRVRLDLSLDLLRKVPEFAQKQHCTPFMIYVAAYCLLLHRLTGQQELLIGIPTLGRGLKGSELMVGYCTHLLPIKSQIESLNQPFNEFLIATRRQLLSGYQHQDYPYAQLLKQWRQQKDHGTAPLIATVFNLDQPGVLPEMVNLRAEWLPQSVAFTPFDLTFNLTDIGTAAVLECDYDSDILTAETVQRWAGHYVTLLAELMNHPTQSVYELSLLTPEQRQQLLVQWNQTAQPYPRNQTIADLLTEKATQMDQAMALQFQDKTLTFAELNQQVNQLAHYLQNKGVKPDTIVGVCLTRQPALIVSLWAILKAGGAYLPLDPSYPAARLAFMLDDAQVSVLLTETALLPQLPNTQATVVCVDRDAPQWAEMAKSNPISAATAQNLAYLIYTSGSTGKPKGTMIEHRGLVNYLTWAVQAYEVAQGSGVPVHASMSFDATITSLFAASLAGKPLFLLPEKQHEAEVVTTDLLALLNSSSHLSLIKLTPAHLELLNPLLNTETLQQQCRYVILGGEALTTKQVAIWREFAPNIRLINEYGPTETVVGCCVYQVDADTPTQGQVPIGRPIANTQLYVLDATLRPVPIGVMGELYIGGDGVARGYHQRPELTAERFIPDPFNANSSSRLYKTGDLARYRADGILEYLGRIDNQVKVRGFRVELGEIETVLAQHAQVREAAVIAHRFSAQDVRLIAYYALKKGAVLDELTLRHTLSQQLPAHEMPAMFIQLPELPLTSNGKVDRAALPIPTQIQTQSAVAFLAASNSVEQQLVAIWQDLLHVKQVGVNDNFFDLGGHSLLILPMCEQIAQQLNYTLSPVDVFKYPTIRTLSALIQPSDNTPTLSKHQKAKQRNPNKKAVFRGLRG
ncbi:hypothetical protein TPSD3_07295 [Thioflexithrix psekupsensis]|uniref:Carrier domain-containing protein n=2 Tax=Thioflexithrix psekupsensis TaxID=1570016 RepID=A0A251X9F6_9GAMM|nr:hypothetical protein TPSD3_07295 [Thioflexithrix psekupsensis]